MFTMALHGPYFHSLKVYKPLGYNNEMKRQQDGMKERHTDLLITIITTCKREYNYKNESQNTV